MELFKIFGTIGIKGAKDVERELKGVSANADKTHKTMQKGFSGYAASIGAGLTNIGNKWTNFGGKVADFGSKMTQRITAPALAAGAAVAGIVAFKGWGRLQQIDDAKGKLLGLGYTAEQTNSIIKSASDVTAKSMFNTAEAAGVAANMIAAGVKPGQELDHTLKQIANAATIAGTDMDDLGYIFGKVAANGKATGLEVKMLGDRGIPMLQWIAKEYGVTTEEASKMVAQGEIDFEKFNHLIQTNIGDAAENGGATFTGAMKNIGSAVSRVGEKIFGSWQEETGIFYIIKQQAGKLNDFLRSDAIQNAAKQIGEKLSEVASYAIEKFGELGEIFGFTGMSADDVGGKIESMGEAAKAGIDKLVDTIRSLKEWWDGLNPAMQEFIKKLPLILLVAGPIITVIGKVIIFVGAVMKAVGAIATFVAAFNPVTAIILGVIAVIVAIIAIWILWGDEIKAFVGNVISWFKELPGKLKAVWDKATQAVADFVVGVVTYFYELGYKIAQAVLDLKDAAVEKFNELKDSVIAAVTWLKDKAIELVVLLVTGYINYLLWLKDKAIAAVTWLKDKAVQLFTALKDRAISVATGMRDGIVDRFTAARDKAVAIFTAIRDKIKSIIEGARDVVKGAIDKIKSFFNFSWSLPKLKMPKIKIDGSFNIMPPSVPKFSIDWYKDGGILTKPTLFGQQGNTFMGGGEAGHEAVLPIELLRQYIADAMAENGGRSEEYLAQLVGLMEQFLPALIGMQVVMDGGALVGAISPGMDKQLGSMDTTRSRGGTT